MGNPLALPSSPTSVPSSQPANLTNRFPNGECLDICNVADDREVHSAIVPELRRAVNLPSNRSGISCGAKRRQMDAVVRRPPCHSPRDFEAPAKRVRMYSAALSGASRTLPGPLRT